MPRGDSYREVFANRSFTVLWAGQALAYLGQSITYVAVAALSGGHRAIANFVTEKGRTT